MAGERAYAQAGINAGQIDFADLYSCFPAAVQSFALDLKLEGVCPWTVTGSMAFAGGPYNHAALDGVARMVEVLRAEAVKRPAPHFGLTSNLSGIFGKQAVAIFSDQPGEGGYGFEDITAEVAAKDPPVPSTTGYEGPAQVAGYTVSYSRNEISHGFAYCDTADGRRAVARSEDRGLLERMTVEEFVGRPVLIGADGTFCFPVQERNQAG
jgi:acetyl-CoA C-acetyltransferase